MIKHSPGVPPIMPEIGLFAVRPPIFDGELRGGGVFGRQGLYGGGHLADHGLPDGGPTLIAIGGNSNSDAEDASDAAKLKPPPL